MKLRLLLTLASLYIIGCDKSVEPIDPLILGEWEFVRAKLITIERVPRYIYPEEYGRNIEVVFDADKQFEITYIYPDQTNTTEGTYKTEDDRWLTLNFSGGTKVNSQYHVDENYLDFGLGNKGGEPIPVVWEFIRAEN